MQIDGLVQGTITAGQTVTVGKNAEIQASIKAAAVIVAGRVKGNVVAKDRVELVAGSRLDGDVTTKTLVVAEGATLNGKCAMNGAGSEGRGSGKEKEREGEAVSRRTGAVA
jgi:cytoskeletal protein CcmA (bactofilin family)